jgi:TDG/mug DNA glycosylase family protein
MVKTRSKNQKSISPAEPDLKDEELSDTNKTEPQASFKGRLVKYEYDQAAKQDGNVSTIVARSQNTTKRSRIEDSASTESQPKKKRTANKYANPSKYAHLSPLVDILEPNLVCIFVGTNPGVATATAGHAYAHPSNHFWRLLHSSGLTDRRLKPEEDRSLPALYCMGNTNIVERPSKDAAELSKEEMSAGTASLDSKFLECKPEAVCIVGKGIWEAIWRYRYGRNMKKGEFEYGWQDEKHNMGKSKEGEEDYDANKKIWNGARVFVTTSTSGLAASLKPAEKEAIWRPFGEWVQKRRAERGFISRKVAD